MDINNKVTIQRLRIRIPSAFLFGILDNQTKQSEQQARNGLRNTDQRWNRFREVYVITLRFLETQASYLCKEPLGKRGRFKNRLFQ